MKKRYTLHYRTDSGRVTIIKLQVKVGLSNAAPSRERWGRVLSTLQVAANFLAGRNLAAALASGTIGNDAGRLIDDAEYLERAAQFLRRAEAHILEVSSRK